jgi:hypothetical protein
MNLSEACQNGFHAAIHFYTFDLKATQN